MSDKHPLAQPAEVAEYMGVPVDTLKRWRLVRRGPKWIPVGRHVRYRWVDVEAWLDEQSAAAGRIA